VHCSSGSWVLGFLFRPQPVLHASPRLVGRATRLARPVPRSRSTGSGAASTWRHRFCRPNCRTGRYGAAKTAPPLQPSRVCRFALRGCTFPPPARRHASCSGRLSCGLTCRAGNRRAGALVARPHSCGRTFPSRPRRVTPVASRAKRNAIVRAGNGRATPARPACGSRVSSSRVPPPQPRVRARVACGCA
jgi:hypothetical protein